MRRKVLAKRTLLVVSAILVVAAVICGCSSGSKIAQDAVLARDILDSVYAGSLTPLRAKIDPTYAKMMPDFVSAGTASVLKKDFGQSKSVAFKSSRRIQLGATQAIWTVSGSIASYEMKLVFDKSDKLIDIGFKPVSDPKWSTATEMGISHAKQQKKAGAGR